MPLLITRGLGSGPGLITRGLEGSAGPTPVVENGILYLDPFKDVRQRGIQFANVIDKSNEADADIGGAPGPSRAHTNARMGVYMAQQGVGLRTPQGGSYSGAIKYRFRNSRTFPVPNGILGQGTEIFPFTGGPAAPIPSFCDFMWYSASLPVRYFVPDSIAKFGDGRIVVMEKVGFDGWVLGDTPVRANIFSADGTTVVTGGFSTNPIAAGDPITTISPFGKMCSVGDGRVLSFEESLISSSLDSSWAEIIDPTTLQWTALPLPMDYERDDLPFDPHDGFTLTEMNDGNVLKVGGRINNFTIASGSTRFNYATNTWTSRARMREARLNHTATKLLDGRILVAGGFSEGFFGAAMVNCEIYDSGSNTWTDAAPMHQARFGHLATLLPNGKVLVIGYADGFADDSLKTTTELYDPGTNSWQIVASTSGSHNDSSLLVGGDGNAYLLGGVSGNFAAHTGVLAFSPVTNAWYERGTTIFGHRDSRAAFINVGGCVFLGLGSTVAGQITLVSASELSAHP